MCAVAPSVPYECQPTHLPLQETISLTFFVGAFPPASPSQGRASGRRSAGTLPLSVWRQCCPPGATFGTPVATAVQLTRGVYLLVLYDDLILVPLVVCTHAAEWFKYLLGTQQQFRPACFGSCFPHLPLGGALLCFSCHPCVGLGLRAVFVSRLRAQSVIFIFFHE